MERRFKRRVSKISATAARETMASAVRSSALLESLSMINNYSPSTDRAMEKAKSLSLPNDMRGLTKNVKSVLRTTAALHEMQQSNDQDLMLDLQLELANNYADSSPALRRTWLESIGKNHVKEGNFSEAAHCQAHIAALEAEILRRRTGADPQTNPGPADFLRISPNIPRDEGTSAGQRNGDDGDSTDEQHFTEEGLLGTLEFAAHLFARAERYEMVPEIYKVMIPLHEKSRNYEALSRIYKTISTTYDKIISVRSSGKRILGRYYKVCFYGKDYFGEEAGKEFVYKEPNLTSLAEVSARLCDLYGKRFGPENVKLITSEKEINEKEDCDPRYAYVQIIHVHPYHHHDSKRLTDFEKYDNNLNKFMYETPFSLIDRNKPRSERCEHQCKRRTIVTTSHYFPYVVKRIPIVSKTIEILNPIDVAIDEMQSRTNELEEVVKSDRSNQKRLQVLLQLKLQGSISVQVNAGPLAYARAFLGANCLDNNGQPYPSAKVAKLRQVYRNFVMACENALELNARLIAEDQQEYHYSLKINFSDLVRELSNLIWVDGDSVSEKDKTSDLDSDSILEHVLNGCGSISLTGSDGSDDTIHEESYL